MSESVGLFNGTAIICQYTCPTCSLAHSASLILIVMVALNLVVLLLWERKRHGVVYAQEVDERGSLGF